MRAAAGPRNRWRDLILQVAASFRASVDPDEVIARVYLYHAAAIDTEMDLYVRKLGANTLARQIIKHAVDSRVDEQDQLELFPLSEREIARELGLTRLFVPSRQRFVPIHNRDLITVGELREAAQYLRQHARAVDRHAALVDELADLRARDGAK